MEHWGEELFIITNTNGCTNSKLIRTPLSKPGRAHWKDLLPYQPTTKLDYLVVFQDHVVVSGRQNGVIMLKLLETAGATHDLDFPEDCYDASAEHNRQYTSNLFRFSYSSLVTPRSAPLSTRTHPQRAHDWTLAMPGPSVLLKNTPLNPAP